MEMDPDYVVLMEWDTSSSNEFNEFKNDRVKQLESKNIAQASLFVVARLKYLIK